MGLLAMGCRGRVQLRWGMGAVVETIGMGAVPMWVDSPEAVVDEETKAVDEQVGMQGQVRACVWRKSAEQRSEEEKKKKYEKRIKETVVVDSLALSVVFRVSTTTVRSLGCCPVWTRGLR
ncbi:unnamed protein product [Mortierella alpina]